MDQEDRICLLTDKMTQIIGLMSKHLPDDIYDCLIRMRKEEDSQPAGAIYDCMLENMERASSSGRPVCQDTGILQFHIRAGARFPLLAELPGILNEAVRRATIEVPLRPNVVETFTGKNTGTNIGTGAPCIEWTSISDSDDLTIELYMAGGGCSLPGRSMVLMPAAGFEGIRQYVIDTVLDRGINACPPLLVGVGIGTCADRAAVLSKRALLRPVGSRNENSDAAAFEMELIRLLDALRIGPQGLTGRRTVLDVHVEWEAHHPATLAVGVSVGCWATRRACVHVDKELHCQLLSHLRCREQEQKKACTCASE